MLTTCAPNRVGYVTRRRFASSSSTRGRGFGTTVTPLFANDRCNARHAFVANRAWFRNSFALEFEPVVKTFWTTWEARSRKLPHPVPPATDEMSRTCAAPPPANPETGLCVSPSDQKYAAQGKLATPRFSGNLPRKRSNNSLPVPPSPTNSEGRIEDALTSRRSGGMFVSPSCNESRADADDHVQEGSLEADRLSTGYTPPCASSLVNAFHVRQQPDCGWELIKISTMINGRHCSFLHSTEDVLMGATTSTVHRLPACVRGVKTITPQDEQSYIPQSRRNLNAGRGILRNEQLPEPRPFSSTSTA